MHTCISFKYIKSYCQVIKQYKYFKFEGLDKCVIYNEIIFYLIFSIFNTDLTRFNYTL